MDHTELETIEPTTFSARRRLSNPRHERICQLLAKGDMSQTQAYLKVYPDAAEDTARSACSALIAKHNVRTRLDFLLEKAARVAELEPGYVVNTLMESAEKGLETGNLTATNQAAIALGKHLRMFEESPQTTVNQLNVTLQDEDKNALLAALFGKTAALEETTE
jgi:hypothetical protein